MGFAGPPEPIQCSCDISTAIHNHRVQPRWLFLLSDPQDNLSEWEGNSSGKIENFNLEIALGRQVAWADFGKPMD